jgi:hypothetical protein
MIGSRSRAAAISSGVSQPVRVSVRSVTVLLVYCLGFASVSLRSVNAAGVAWHAQGRP